MLAEFRGRGTRDYIRTAVELSANAGQIASPPYDGTLGGGNPATPQAAWCGPRDYIRTAVDLTQNAGQNVRFRFRLTSDASVNRPNGWMVDNVSVQQCVAAP